MTRQDAHDLLDAARDGAEFEGWRIRAALIATGDLDDEGEPIQILTPVGWPSPGRPTCASWVFGLGSMQ